MFKHQKKNLGWIGLQSGIFLVAILLLLLLTRAASGGGGSSNPSCGSIVENTKMDFASNVWDEVSVVCYHIDSEEAVDTLIVKVEALNQLGEYDLYISKGLAKEGRELALKINHQPIDERRNEVQFVFNSDTLDSDTQDTSDNTYTIGVAPTTGYLPGGKVSTKFKTEARTSVKPTAPAKPIPMAPGFFTFREDSVIEKKQSAIYSFEVSTCGVLEATIIPDPAVGNPSLLAVLSSPNGTVRDKTQIDGHEDQSLSYDVKKADINGKTAWTLELTNKGEEDTPVSGMIIKPDIDCLPKKTTTETVEETLQNGTLTVDNKVYTGMKDVTLEQKSKATNHGGDDVCAVTGNDGNGMDLTSLLYWDVSSIAEGSTITGATIKLWVKDPSINTYQIYECKKPWLESQATWLGPDSKANWGHQGAHGSSDRGEPISQLYAKEIGYASIFLDPKLVQAWVDGSKQNHGLIIASGTAKDKITFSCSESNRQSHRPALEITFERS